MTGALALALLAGAQASRPLVAVVAQDEALSSAIPLAVEEALSAFATLVPHEGVIAALTLLPTSCDVARGFATAACLANLGTALGAEEVLGVEVGPEGQTITLRRVGVTSRSLLEERVAGATGAAHPDDLPELARALTRRIFSKATPGEGRVLFKLPYGGVLSVDDGRPVDSRDGPAQYKEGTHRLRLDAENAPPAHGTFDAVDGERLAYAVLPDASLQAKPFETPTAVWLIGIGIGLALGVGLGGAVDTAVVARDPTDSNQIEGAGVAAFFTSWAGFGLGLGATWAIYRALAQ